MRENRHNEEHDYHVIQLNVQHVGRPALPRLWNAGQVVRASVPFFSSPLRLAY